MYDPQRGGLGVAESGEMGSGGEAFLVPNSWFLILRSGVRVLFAILAPLA
jgi:hypothetical protein